MSALPKIAKSALKDELLSIVAADLEALERAQKATVEGATHTEAKPENDKDTRALEQTYLARGQALRVEQLRVDLAELTLMPVPPFTAKNPVGAGALVTIEEEDKTSRFFIAVHGGGARLAKGTIQVITPHSPLGQALIGKFEGDGCDVLLGGRMRTLEIIQIQ